MRASNALLRRIAVSLVASILVSIPGPRVAYAVASAARGTVSGVGLPSAPLGLALGSLAVPGSASLSPAESAPGLRSSLPLLSAPGLSEAPGAAVSPAVRAAAPLSASPKSAAAPAVERDTVSPAKVPARVISGRVAATASEVSPEAPASESGKLRTLSETAASLGARVGSSPLESLKSDAAFDSAALRSPFVSPVSVANSVGRGGPALSRFQVRNPADASVPAVPAKKGPTARGHLTWSAFLVARGALSAWLGMEVLSGSVWLFGFTVATPASWVAIPLFVLAGASAIVGTGYGVLGLRIAGALRREFKGIDADARPSPWSTPIATKDGVEPGFEQLPEHAKKVVGVHARARGRGWGAFRSYLRQAAKFHVPFLLGDIAYIVRGAAAGIRAGLSLVKRMVVGDKRFRFAWLPHKRLFFGAAAFLLLDGFLSMGILWLLQPLLDTGVAAAANGVAAYLPKLFMFSGAFVALLIAYAFTERQHTLLGGLATVYTVRELRNAFRAKFTGLDMGFHSINKSGELSNRLRDDTVRLASKEVQVRYALPHYLTVAVMSIATMFYLIPALAPLVVAVALPIGIISGIFGQKIASYSRQHQDLKADITGHSTEVFENADVMKSFAATEFEAARYDRKADSVKSLDTRIALLWAKYMAINGGVAELFTRFLVFGIGAWLIATVAGMSFGTVTAFAGFAYMVTYSLSGIAQNFLKFSADDGATTRIREIWDQRSKIVEPETEDSLGRLQGRIRFEGVTFAYEDREGSGEKMAPVLNDLSFTIEPGQTVAFVGETASGKSTITNLVMRFWDPDAGKVTIDGVDLRDMKSADLRRNVSIVLQDNRLFNESIRFNVAYGLEGVPDSEIEKALRMAQADFVYDKSLFPDGLEQNVGEGGGKLSGGQRQRIAIARALLRRAPIMIFDEATAALDNESEREVQAAMQKLLDEGEGRTSIVIAHRLSTIRNADKIFVLDHGRIAESGNWEELMAKKGAFYKMRKARELEDPRAPPATAAGQFAAAAVSAAIAAGAVFAGLTLLETSLPWLAGMLVPVFGAAALSAFSFLTTGRAIAKAVRAERKKIESEDPAAAFKRGVWFEPIATAESRSTAFGTLPERYRNFIDLHENAHRDRGVGEVRATLAQLRGIPGLLKAQFSAAREGFRAWRVLVKEFAMGDDVSQPFLKRYRGRILVTAALMVAHAAINTGGAHFVGKILDAGVAMGLAQTATASALLPMLGWLAGALAVGAVFQYFYLRYGGVINAGIIADYRKALNRHFAAQKLKFFKKEGSGELSSHLNGEDLEMLASKNVEIRVPLMTHAATFVLASILMLYTAGPLGIGVYLLPFILGGVNSIFGGRFEKALTKMVEVRAQILGLGKESLALTKVVKAFNGEAQEAQRYGKKNLELTEVGREVYQLQANQWMFESSLTDLFTKHLIYLAGAWLIAYGAGLSAGGIIATTLAASYIKASVQGISKNWIVFKQKRGGAAWVTAQLRAAQEAAARPDAGLDRLPVPELEGRIRFENVDFRYSDDEDSELILKRLSLDIEPGETVAFVGASGSGKSTALHLVQKLYEPQAGRVLIDGLDVAKLDGDELNRQIALVPQEPPLFQNTIRYNLLYGIEASDAEIARALKMADAEFVYGLPQGLETMVGEAGDMFSGGQKQRIAIARAILRNAKILLLDEATSALDGATEARVQRALGESENGRPTTLVVAHNLNTIKNAHRIVVMERGRIVEIGNHDALLAKGGRYTELWNASKGTAKPKE
ncbi:MAG: hypothetical protein CO113_06405 [Elusimicrobia bacterium CG_4_9_14_3_um_filter_62_55]|nr:MAG: hypothetical protein COR54_03415 [Elusimicrobia bacterium CG22_combo_CG10-13_8_21_14_all_63_91]PJA17727.1 MAG: hypothetical protein COX66_03445 [Elusimicrobia bacterium CG_4_10_14_0_2_um_filter_63_34]PJB25904.1 MAG: hypothetical protein CO113_06405 [Elusimicrobia bacterium CG_4_9_14_3_um_filter_62_55]